MESSPGQLWQVFINVIGRSQGLHVMDSWVVQSSHFYQGSLKCHLAAFPDKWEKQCDTNHVAVRGYTAMTRYTKYSPMHTQMLDGVNKCKQNPEVHKYIADSCTNTSCFKSM